MPVILSNLFLRRRIEWVTTSNVQGSPVQKAKMMSAEEPLSNPTNDMPSTYPMTGHSDLTLQRMLDFFAIYKPRPSDIEWAKQRKAEVEAEIARRKLEDEEGMQ